MELWNRRNKGSKRNKIFRSHTTEEWRNRKNIKEKIKRTTIVMKRTWSKVSERNYLKIIIRKG